MPKNEILSADALRREQDALRYAIDKPEGGPLTRLAVACRRWNEKWWRDARTGEPLASRNRAEMIALMHSELSEMLEGLRKNIPDGHLPLLRSEVVEAADLLIRLLDYAGEFLPEFEEAFWAKLRYNASRADHELAARAAPGGKAF